MFTLIYELDGISRRHPLREGTTELGRAPTCDLVISHTSVSRTHARFTVEGTRCSLEDLHSLNGTFRNGEAVTLTHVVGGDSLMFGDVVVQVREAPSAQLALSDDHIIVDPSATRYEPIDRAPGQGADADRLLGALAELGQMLIRAAPLAAVLDRIVDLVFAHIPAERTFLLLEEGDDPRVWRPASAGAEPSADGGSLERRRSAGAAPDRRLVPHVVRSARGPAPSGVTISRTIVRMVMADRVAVQTADAHVDPRLGGAESLKHVRALMCAPLWNAERVIGVLYVDNPQSQQFSDRQLRRLTALASHAGVAIEQARLLARVLEETRRRERLQRYHSPAVVDRILQADAVGEPGPSAEEREVTVLLADIVGFTSIAEHLPPSRVALLLNAYFSRMTDIVFEHDGTLDKFIGDALLAVFGAPLEQADHARRAVDAAQAMLRAIEAINAERGGTPLQMRIALSTGVGLVGDIGSPRRREFTVLGDVVNTAARLEQEVARPGQIVMTRATRDRLRDEVPTRPLGRVQLRGRAGAIDAFAVG